MPSGQLHRDTKFSSIYLDSAKTHANPDADGNSLNRRAVIANEQRNNKLDFIVTTPLGNATAHLAHLLLRDT